VKKFTRDQLEGGSYISQTLTQAKKGRNCCCKERRKRDPPQEPNREKHGAWWGELGVNEYSLEKSREQRVMPQNTKERAQKVQKKRGKIN